MCSSTFPVQNHIKLRKSTTYQHTRRTAFTWLPRKEIVLLRCTSAKRFRAHITKASMSGQTRWAPDDDFVGPVPGTSIPMSTLSLLLGRIVTIDGFDDAFQLLAVDERYYGSPITVCTTTEPWSWPSRGPQSRVPSRISCWRTAKCCTTSSRRMRRKVKASCKYSFNTNLSFPCSPCSIRPLF